MPKDRHRAGGANQTEAAESLVASAVRYPGSTTKIYRTVRDWQTEAWRHYNQCGELRYATNWIANVLSRATLHAAQRTPEGLKAITTGPAADVMEVLFSGKNGQAQMLHAYGLHLAVAGECYLIGRVQDGEDTWEVLGVEVVKHSGNRWWIQYGEGMAPEYLEDSDVVIRIWRPHPRNPMEADSPVRAVLPILTEIEWLTKRIFATVSSRLAGAGVLEISQNLEFPTPEGYTPTGNAAQDFMASLGETMMTAIKDPGHASAMVPIIIAMPDEIVGKMKYTTFWSDLDDNAVELRTEAIRRLALGMDLPPEVLLGTADANHWTGWQIEESSIKAHIEPLLELVANALTVGYLRPNVDEDPSFVVAFDTSALRLRPNRSREAIELYDRGELDGEALRRETGFMEDDRMDEEEMKNWLVRKVAMGSPQPELVAQALVKLGVIDALPEPEVPAMEPPGPWVPSPTGQAPTLEDHPVTGPPEAAVDPLVVGQAEGLVTRALERAGNKIKNRTQVRPPGVKAAQLYLHVQPRDLDHLLDDAWSCAPDLLGADCGALVERLDRYARHLLADQRPHDRGLMLRYLTNRLVTA